MWEIVMFCHTSQFTLDFVSCYQFILYSTTPFFSFNIVSYLLNVGFNGKYYLWGAFRSHPISQRPGDGKRTVGNSTIERCVPSSAGDELFRSTCDKEPEKRLLEWMGENPGSSNDTDNDELALFPLNVEDIAVKARVGGRLGLDLELGLSRPVDEDHEASLGCKPRSGGTTDASLAFDNAVIALNSRSVA